MIRQPWPEMEPLIRDRAYRRIDDDPNILLETDTYGASIDADLFYARLIGFDEQIVTDGLPLRRVEPVILAPIPLPRRALSAHFTDESWLEPLRAAEYRLQSCHCVLSVAGERYSDLPTERLRPDHTVKIAYLRYRRRI